MISPVKHAQALTIKRFTVEEYHRLGELGFLTADDRIELIRGELVYMTAKGTAHEVCLTKLLRELPRLSDQATVRFQSPIILTGSEPEPDFTIVKNRSDDYLEAHQTSENVWLLIEISDSSLTYDQETKLNLYAEYNIQDTGSLTYWKTF